LIPGIAAALAVLLIVFLSAGANAGGDNVVTQTVKGSFESTITKLKKAITAHKLVIVKEVPYTKMLGMVGVKAEKIAGLEIFHPRYGKVLYANDKDAFLEVPLRILVMQTGDDTMIRYRKPSAALADYSGLSSLGDELDQVFAKIVDSVAK
jgi:uncharacterized protein (DUF302 family)